MNTPRSNSVIVGSFAEEFRRMGITFTSGREESTCNLVLLHNSASKISRPTVDASRNINLFPHLRPGSHQMQMLVMKLNTASSEPTEHWVLSEKRVCENYNFKHSTKLMIHSGVSCTGQSQPFTCLPWTLPLSFVNTIYCADTDLPSRRYIHSTFVKSFLSLLKMSFPQFRILTYLLFLAVPTMMLNLI